MTGYLQGDKAAAEYLGVSAKTFQRWQDDPTLDGRQFLRPRIIRGAKYYRVAKLDRFMDPDLNTSDPRSPIQNLHPQPI